jgi:DNA-binding MarR family transcriptional regulator
MQPQLYWHIHKLAFLLEKKSDEILRDQLSIGFAQYKVLEAISHNTLAKQNLIAELLDQTEASISRQIKLLEKKGLIVVSQVMGNKRARELSLTMQGEETVSQAKQLLDIATSQITGVLSMQEQRTVQELILRMIEQARNPI